MSDEFDLDADVDVDVDVDVDGAWSADASPANDDRDELQNSHPGDEAGTAGESADPETRGPYYPNAYRFFADFLAPSYRRKTVDHPAMRWCPSWFLHPEARARVDALWRAWEYLRLDPATGMSVWWKDHADHHMSRLLSPDGTFKDCTPEHRQIHPLPTITIPAELLALHTPDSPVSPA